MNNRYEFIKMIDPKFESPQDWTDISDFTIFNLDKSNNVCINKRNSPLKRTLSTLSIDISNNIYKSNNSKQNTWFYKVKNSFIMMFLFCALSYGIKIKI